MGEALGADPAYSGHLTKNPLSQKWKVIATGAAYDMVDLFSELGAAPMFRLDPLDVSKELGRNCRLFQAARVVAYRLVSSVDQEEEFHKQVLAICQERNVGNLPPNEVKNIAKSIARWTWRKRWEIGRWKKILSAEDIRSRQQAAARGTHRKQVDRTERLIISAIKAMMRKGEKVTKAGVAKCIGRSRQHISTRYSHLFPEVQSRQVCPPPFQDTAKVLGVEDSTTPQTTVIFPSPAPGVEVLICSAATTEGRGRRVGGRSRELGRESDSGRDERIGR